MNDEVILKFLTMRITTLVTPHYIAMSGNYIVLFELCIEPPMQNQCPSCLKEGVLSIS